MKTNKLPHLLFIAVTPYKQFSNETMYYIIKYTYKSRANFTAKEALLNSKGCGKLSRN
jgi:hypothetical protein